MSHHHHDHNHSVGNIRIAFFLNLGFTIIEIIGGLLTNSLAILSDAVHDLGDSLSLGLSWYFQKLSEKGRTKTFSYGFKRFSLLAAIINSTILFVGSILIMIRAVPELLAPEPTDSEGMLYLSILGIAVNGLAVFRLRGGHSMNEKVLFLHLLEDVLGWIAILIGSIVMMNFDLPFIDPLLSVLISLFILYNAGKNLRKSLMVVLQATPESVDIEKVKQKIQAIEEVQDMHDCHVWSLDGEYNILTIHIKLKKDFSLSEQTGIKQHIRDSLKDESIDHFTIELETSEEDCGD